MNSNTCSIISRKCVVSKRNLTTWRFLCQTDNIIQRPYWFTVKIPKCCSVCQKGKSPLFAKLPSFSNMQAVSIFGQAISGRRGLAVPIPRYNLWKTYLSPPLPENNSSSRPLSATTALASTSLTNQRPSNDLVCNRIRLPSNPCEIQVNLPCTVEKKSLGSRNGKLGSLWLNNFSVKLYHMQMSQFGWVDWFHPRSE